MSKKHYKAIAEMFKKLAEEYNGRPDAREALGCAVLLFADIASRDNALFDKARFLKAAGL